MAITTDGCAMMKKLGRLVSPFQQLCYAHGLQLVIQDVFYRIQPINETELFYASGTDEDENISEDEEDGGCTVQIGTEQENRIGLSYDISDMT